VDKIKDLLRQVPWRWLLYWLLIPNAAIMLMWFVGGPPMDIALAIFGAVALGVAQASSIWAKRLVLLGMIAELNYYYVCAMFNLSPGNWSMLPGFVREVQPLRSPEYLVAAAVCVTVAVISLVKAPRVPRFSTPLAYACGALFVVVLVGTDHQATAATRGSYRTAPAPGAVYTSATLQAGLTMPRPDRRNVVVIVVEALGSPIDPEGKALFAADWNRAHWRSRYDVQNGKVPFYGSTTNGELRELCNKWGNYTDFDFARTDCLPKRFLRAGYETIAYHGFAKLMFDRDRWFPRMGLQHLSFGEELLDQGLSICPGVFPGACDTEIAPLIGKRLKQRGKPQFIYWMTLNSHLPVLKSEGLGTANCTLGSRGWADAHPQVCRLFLVHHHLADAIDALVMDKDLPPTDFVIVGDHVPPFFDRSSRSLFDNASVPWLALHYRGGASSTLGDSLSNTR
jgi:hypothetical protein